MTTVPWLYVGLTTVTCTSPCAARPIPHRGRCKGDPSPCRPLHVIREISSIRRHAEKVWRARPLVDGSGRATPWAGPDARPGEPDGNARAGTRSRDSPHSAPDGLLAPP